MGDTNGTQGVAVNDVPAYPDVPTYLNVLGSLHIWEGDGWKAESLSWKKGAYIASNLSGLPEITFSGPHAQEFLSHAFDSGVIQTGDASSPGPTRDEIADVFHQREPGEIEPDKADRDQTGQRE